MGGKINKAVDIAFVAAISNLTQGHLPSFLLALIM